MSDQIGLTALADKMGVSEETLSERWSDPVNIMEDVFQVRDLDTGKMKPLELFAVQKNVVRAYFDDKPDTLSLYKGRRIGYSFITIMCFLVEGMMIPESHYPLVSRTKSQAKNRIDDIQTLLDHSRIQIPVETDNTDHIELGNGTTFTAYSGDADASRGDDSAKAVLLDEMAFIEDEEGAARSFGAFLALGTNRTMVQVSTPNTDNDLFLRTHRDGKPPEEYDGEGTLSIKQPTFYNSGQIDPETSLLEQNVEPVRPDINISQVENERASDPQGFMQEYCCAPVVDEYRFFSADAIEAACEKGSADDYFTGVGGDHHGKLVMGIDVGITGDDTVVSITEHKNGNRYQRYVEAIDNRTLQDYGFSDPDRGNAHQVTRYFADLFKEAGCDLLVIDKTGAGMTFPKMLRRRIGRSIISVNFRDKDTIADMMGDMNLHLRRGQVTLVNDDRLSAELKAIVKDKNYEDSRPRFTGKENSPTGKDDMAIATVLSCFPPNMDGDGAPGAAYKEYEGDEELGEAIQKPATPTKDPNKEEEERRQLAYGSIASGRKSGRNKRYESRYSR